jgi:hypothetical protein
MSVMIDHDRVPLRLAWLSTDSVKELADSMSEIQVMRDQHSRQQVVERVKAGNRAFDPPRSRRDFEDINNLITACQADDESFDLLLEAIEIYTPPDDPGLPRLKNLVTRLLPRAAITKGELQKLLALKPDEIVNAGQLESGIRKSLPELTGDRGSAFKPDNVRQAALFLLDAPSAEDGLVRLLRFIDWLAALSSLLADQSRGDDLHDWTRQVSATHGVAVTAWQQLAEPARPNVPDDKGALGVVDPPAEGVITLHPETEQLPTDTARQDESRARDSDAAEAGRRSEPRYLADHGEDASAAVLSIHDRRLRVLANALNQIVPSIFGDSRLKGKLLNDANSALRSINPLIEAVSAAAKNESQPTRRGDLQELDDILQTRREAVSQKLTALGKKRSERAAERLCDDLKKEATCLLDAGKQAVRYVT